MIGMTDMHCHIVPGVDDGASEKEVKELLQMEYDSGVRTIILTPHYRKGMFETSLKTVIEQAMLVKQTALDMALDMEIYLGCEYHANNDMIEELNQIECYRMNGGKYVLVEFSSGHSYMKIRNWIYQLITSGYKPIIAHVERYPMVTDKMEKLEELIRLGAKLQVSSGAVLGQHGFGTKLLARKLLKKRMVHFVGSDAHDTRDRKPNLDLCATYVAKKMGEAYAKEIFIENPRCIFE